MRLAVTSFSAGFHAKNNTAPVLDEICDATFIPWHQWHLLKEEEYDAVYIIGWYVSTMQGEQQHLDKIKTGKPVIIHWAGTDVTCVENYKEVTDCSKMIESLNADHIIHFAGREQLIKEVKALGIKKITQCPVASAMEVEPWPFLIKQGGATDPLVSVYMPAKRTDFFNLDTVLKVAERLPDIPFILCSFSSSDEHEAIAPNVANWGKLSRARMKQLIEASTVHLRIVDHDGMSLSVIENCCAGRRVVCNQPYPELPTIPNDVDKIVEAIEGYAYLKEPDFEIAKHYQENYGPERQRKEVVMALRKQGVNI